MNTSILRSLDRDLWLWRRPGASKSPKGTLAEPSKSLFEPLGVQWPNFIDFLPPQSDIKKLWIFDISQKRPKTTPQVTLGRPSVDFCSKRTSPRGHFLTISRHYSGTLNIEKTLYFTVFFVIPDLKNNRYFHRFVITFSYFFRIPSKRAFLEAQGSNPCATMWFWSNFRSQGDPKNDRWTDNFDHKASKSRVPRTTPSVLQPTWVRPATQNGPRAHFHQSGIDLGSI